MTAALRFMHSVSFSTQEPKTHFSLSNSVCVSGSLKFSAKMGGQPSFIVQPLSHVSPLLARHGS